MALETEETKAERNSQELSGVDQWFENFEVFFRDHIIANYFALKNNRIALMVVLVLVSGTLFLKTTTFLFGLFKRVNFHLSILQFTSFFYKKFFSFLNRL